MAKYIRANGANIDPLMKSPPQSSALPWYLVSNSLAISGMTLQGFLFTWLLIGELDTPPEQVGYARSIAEFFALIPLLLGGFIADRSESRSYILRVQFFMLLPPLCLAWVVSDGALSYWWVVGFATVMASLNSLVDPARQAIINRVTRFDIQRTVTLITVVSSIVGMGGFYLGGNLETIGLFWLFVIQGGIFALSLGALLPLDPMPNTSPRSKLELLAGLHAVWQQKIVRNIMGLSFLSNLFNGGAYIIAIPFIVTQVYSGGPEMLADVFIAFTAGSVSSNLLLLAIMPLTYPGRLFVSMQVTRIAILVVLISQPPLWLFYVMMFIWGLNMGVTTTMVRTTVQELAQANHRAKILAILLFSFLCASFFSSPLLGLLIKYTSPLTALYPGIIVSLVVVFIGYFKSGLWQYRSGGSKQGNL